MISVITTNIFPGQDHLEMVMKCLHAQTCQDFEWLLLDGHFNNNLSYIKNLCEKYKIKQYLHVPLCKANHVGRLFHWEVYNNALMLANYDLFLRFGTYRWFHKDVIEKVIEYAQKGIYLDFPHKTVNLENYLVLDQNQINYKLSPYFEDVRNHMECSAGMFSYSRNNMLGINGNNEAATLLVHSEDSDINARWTNVKGIQSIKTQDALFRFDHPKHQANLLSILEEGNSSCCRKDGCLSTYPNFHHLTHEPPVNNQKFIYRDFQWIKCECCGIVSPVDIDDYLEYLKIYNNPFGPVAVDGRVGRNIVILYNDIIKINNINDKLNLLLDSHTNKKYLKDEILYNNSNYYNKKSDFKENIKEYCKKNNIYFIDRNLLSNKHLKDRQIDDKIEFNIDEYLLPYIENNNDIFLFEILQDVNNIKRLNNIFSSCKSNRIFISMKHEKYPNIEKIYNPINWWDEYINENKKIYSDSKDADILRSNIDKKYQEYLGCFFCIKKR